MLKYPQTERVEVLFSLQSIVDQIKMIQESNVFLF